MPRRSATLPPPLVPDPEPLLEAAVNVARQEHLRRLREPLIARMLVHPAVYLLDDALAPLNGRRCVLEHVADDGKECERPSPH